MKNSPAAITISSPIPAAISAANATPRVAATSPACGPNRGLVRRGEVRTAIGRLLNVPASLPDRAGAVSGAGPRNPGVPRSTRLAWPVPALMLLTLVKLHSR